MLVSVKVDDDDADADDESWWWLSIDERYLVIKVIYYLVMKVI